METKTAIKHLVKIEMPERLLKEILYVHYLIAKKDKSAVEECDDCIQTEHICGGLWNKKKQSYGFSYYPDTNTDVYWNFELNKKQIIKIAKGKVGHLNLWKCNNPVCKNYYAHENNICSFCNPIDTTYKPQHSIEELQEMQEKKDKLFDKWKRRNSN